MQYATVLLRQCVHCDWLKHSQPPTHQVIQPIRLFTPSYLICMCISARQNILANQICVLYTHKSCPIVGEIASSPMEGSRTTEILICFFMPCHCYTDLCFHVMPFIYWFVFSCHAIHILICVSMLCHWLLICVFMPCHWLLICVFRDNELEMREKLRDTGLRKEEKMAVQDDTPTKYTRQTEVVISKCHTSGKICYLSMVSSNQRLSHQL